MSIVKNSVLLLKAERPETGTDKYETLLKSNNFEVIQVKTLTFDYKNFETLKEKLLKPDNYSGILLSSPRCVNAVSQALSKEEIQGLWRSKANYTVGETTYEESLQKLGLECRGKETGNAKNLSLLILQDKILYTKPFLFPHGNLKTDTLQTELGNEKIQVEGVLVYETISNPNIEDELCKATDNFSTLPEFTVFFSPSGVKSSINYLRKIPLDLNNAKFIAIGPVTEVALREANLNVFKVAKSPTPEEVLNAIKT